MHTLNLDYTAIIENLPIGMFVVDIDGEGRLTCVLANRTFKGYLPSSLLESVEFWNDGEFGVYLAACQREKTPQHFEWIQDRELDQACYECQAIPQFDDKGRVRRILGTATDRTKQRRAEQHMLQQALHDTLTSLPNRVLFEEMLEQSEQQRKMNSERRFAVLYVDVDRLQSINDSLGHLTGDELLVAFARRLQQCLGTQHFAARISGDEFAVLIKQYECLSEVTDFADSIHKALDRPFKLGGSEVFASVGIGIGTSERGQPHAEDVARDADIAMHRAKRHGRGQTVIFREDRHDRERSMLHLETDIRRAIDEGQFLLHFQPIVCLDTGRVESTEALIRWHHPVHGMLSPTTFIPLAEETGMIVPLGHWAMEAACRQWTEWQHAFPRTAPDMMCVNVSSTQLRRDEFVEDVFAVMERVGMPVGRMKIEITESVMMDNPDQAAEVLNRLRSRGVPLAIDDFGTGHSSLSYLQRFPFDVLKVDRSFVSRMMEEDGSDKIVQIITALAHTLGMDLIAEGIETAAQLDRVKELGCRLGQGYLFSRPVPAANLAPVFETTGTIIPPGTCLG